MEKTDNNNNNNNNNVSGDGQHQVFRPSRVPLAQVGFMSSQQTHKTHKTKKTKNTTQPKIASPIKKAIEQDAHYGMLINNNINGIVRDVDFSVRTPEGMVDMKHKIMITDVMPKDRDIIFLFPNHFDPKKRKLNIRTIRRLNTLNTIINTRLRESLTQTAHSGDIRLAFAYGNHIYVCNNVWGTIYLVYAKYMCVTTYGRTTNLIDRDVPLIFNLTGEGPMKSIFRPKIDVENEWDLETIPIHKHWPELYQPNNVAFWVCEQDTRRAPKSTLHSLSEEKAISMVTQQTNGRAKLVRKEGNAFASSVDCEEEEDQDNSESGEVELTFACVAPPSITEHRLNDPTIADLGTHRGGLYGRSMYNPLSGTGTNILSPPSSDHSIDTTTSEEKSEEKGKEEEEEEEEEEGKHLPSNQEDNPFDDSEEEEDEDRDKDDEDEDKDDEDEDEGGN